MNFFSFFLVLSIHLNIFFSQKKNLKSDLHHPNIMELVLASHCPLMCIGKNNINIFVFFKKKHYFVLFSNKIVTKYMSGGNLFHLIHDNSFKNDLAFVKILRDIVNSLIFEKKSKF